MKLRRYIPVPALTLFLLASCSGNPRLDISMSEKFEGQKVEIINFLDSAHIASTNIVDGKANVIGDKSKPVFTSVLIDGRTRAFYITERGTAYINDSTNSAIGTPLNNKFSALLATLDSIENLDDMNSYLDFVEKAYNENKENPIGSYFGIEWIKYADAETVDSILNDASEELRTSPKAAYYQNFAHLRDATAPGRTYVDIEGENEAGRPVKLSDYISPDAYTLVDFWASWCPYCIKELPEMAALKEKWNGQLNVVGIAVRDVPDDTKAAIKKHTISWPVIYNTQRRPYDIYGFSGIPHHILLAPDGTILSRGENLQQIDTRLSDITESN